MRRLATGLGLFIALCWGSGLAHAFPLDADWTVERELDYPLYTEEGRCLLGKTTVMRHEASREWRGLFSPFDNDVVILSGGVEEAADGTARKIVKLEASNTVGHYVDFRPVFEHGQCTAFDVVLFDEADRELAREVVYRDAFEALVGEGDIPSVTACEPGRVSQTVLGRWADFSCPSATSQVFLFSPFDSAEPMVAVWHERGSADKDDLRVFFALKTRSGRWAKTRMINDHQLQWDVLKHGDERVMAIEVTLRDETGHAFIRRMYDQSEPGEP